MKVLNVLVVGVCLALTMGEASARIMTQPDQTNIYIAEWSKLRHFADLGDVNAQYQLANYYYEPPERSSLPRSYSKAAKYYRMAAEQNHAPSQHNLGVLYLKGQGVERDWVKAYAWFSLSAAQGYRAAIDAVNTLSPRLDDNEKHQADVIEAELKQHIRPPKN